MGEGGLLTEHRLLLIWDNFEAVHSMPDPSGATPPLGTADRDELARFLHQVATGGRGAVIITSRGEEPWLGELRRIPVTGLDPDEAIEYADQVLAPYPTAAPRRAQRAFAELMDWLDGHPLSMRLILPHLETTDPQALLAALRGLTPYPATTTADAPPPYQPASPTPSPTCPPQFRTVGLSGRTVAMSWRRPGRRPLTRAKCSIAGTVHSGPVATRATGAGNRVFEAANWCTRCRDTPRISAASAAEANGGKSGRNVSASNRSDVATRKSTTVSGSTLSCRAVRALASMAFATSSACTFIVSVYPGPAAQRETVASCFSAASSSSIRRCSVGGSPVSTQTRIIQSITIALLSCARRVVPSSTATATAARAHGRR
ncbi:MAG: hypothetical protein ACRDTF_21720 [Pseudonocardiaceae bacterium]